ncbi:GDSL-type esterase/lipase family protein [Flavisericum labens]|uniref:GDSL-type esterase/lipase family protein n=1 Tax=Flavisericum labens TaxID=3377112 RepID=UPI00387B3005
MKKFIKTEVKFRMFFCIIVFLSLNIAANAQEDRVKIACIGNSITQGSHLENPAEDCYPTQLREMLFKTYGDTCVVNNYGLSGRNMLKNGPNPIWKEPKFHQALKWAPDICFILLGTNDSPPDLWADLGDEFLTDYLSMIDTLKSRNPSMKFIMGSPPPIWKGHRYGGDTWGKKHNDSIMVNSIIPKIETVSEKTNAILIDFHTPFVDRVELFPDYLHPNPVGANQIAKLILEVISKNDMIHEVEKSKSSDNNIDKKQDAPHQD